MMEQCPKCGSPLAYKTTEWLVYECDTGVRLTDHKSIKSGDIVVSKGCLRNQLAAANNRIAVLENVLELLAGENLESFIDQSTMPCAIRPDGVCGGQDLLPLCRDCEVALAYALAEAELNGQAEGNGD